MRKKANGGAGNDISRSPPDLSHVPCKFYRQGTCQAGNSCPFSHSQDLGAEQAPCKYFQKGNCKFGAKCMLAHILPDGRRVNPRTPFAGQQSQFQRITPETNFPSKSALHSSLLQASLVEHNYKDDFPSLPSSKDDEEEPLESLNAPLPASLDYDGISYFARHGPLAASVPAKFENLMKTNQASEQRTQHAVHIAPISKARSPYPNGSTSSASPGTVRALEESLGATRPASSSFPAHGGLLWSNKLPDKSTKFVFEEDFVPSSLQELLTPVERMRKAQTHDEMVPSISEPLSSQSSSPSQSRFGALFERHKREEAMAGSPLRHSYGTSPLALSPPNTSRPLSPTFRAVSSVSGNASPYLASPPRQSLPLPLRQKMLRSGSATERSELQATANPWQPFHNVRMDRSTNSGSSTAVDEEPTFFMEEDVINRLDALSTN